MGRLVIIGGRRNVFRFSPLSIRLAIGLVSMLLVCWNTKPHFFLFQISFSKHFLVILLWKMSSKEKVNNIIYPCLQHSSWIKKQILTFCQFHLTPDFFRVYHYLFPFVLRSGLTLHTRLWSESQQTSCLSYSLLTWLLKYFKRVFSEHIVGIFYGLKGSPSLIYIKQI